MNLDQVSDTIRVGIRVKGIVQGVGFRPTIYNHAVQSNVVGFIYNDSLGVYIEAEGAELSVNSFINNIKFNSPSLSTIDSVDIETLALKKIEQSFSILKSIDKGSKTALISPDCSICKDCKSEILKSGGRRYNHPFTNCTNCGPRYSIIRARPYDRVKTTMSGFNMCLSCKGEYENPADRRFHAQPNCCKECGPSVFIMDHKSIENPIPFIIDAISGGKIVAVKGVGGFNILCDPFNENSVSRLRKLKKRPRRSFALMAKNIMVVDKQCYLTDVEAKGLSSAEAPIVLLKKRSDDLNKVSPDNNYLGIMLPYTPLHLIIMKYFDFLIATSANIAGGPIAICDDEIRKLVDSGIVDYSLTNDREIVNRSDDSIVQYIGDSRQVIRRSRGFVPKPFKVSNFAGIPSLALGANYKNSFSIGQGDSIFMSTHIGDLEDNGNYNFQESSIESFKELLDIKPARVLGDAHPGYENYNKTTDKIYHHHAHMISAMGEHGLLGEDVLGVICDGVGYGTDGNMWGFEFLTVGENYRQFVRAGHLNYFSLAGGDRAQKEIDRVGISLLSKLQNVNSIYEVDRVKLINCVLKNRTFSPLTSSLGRLFDGVASILGIIHNVQYEAQAAMLLQSLAEKAYENPEIKSDLTYSVEINKGVPFTIGYGLLMKEIIFDLNAKTDSALIALKFHNWVVDVIVAGVMQTDKKKIVFSGGCFQNRLLVDIIIKKMKTINREYWFNQEVPINDGGISFGQILM